MEGQLSIFDFIKTDKAAALWKYDTDLGIAFFCPDCKRFICSSGKCKCGTEINLNKPKKKYSGKIRWH